MFPIANERNTARYCCSGLQVCSMPTGTRGDHNTQNENPVRFINAAKVGSERAGLLSRWSVMSVDALITLHPGSRPVRTAAPLKLHNSLLQHDENHANTRCKAMVLRSAKRHLLHGTKVCPGPLSGERACRHPNLQNKVHPGSRATRMAPSGSLVTGLPARKTVKWHIHMGINAWHEDKPPRTGKDRARRPGGNLAIASLTSKNPTACAASRTHTKPKQASWPQQLSSSAM